MTKYIFVTGGVVSSIGKGIVAASLGRLLKNRGLKVTIQKFDPYINVDPGTMSPYQHGEVRWFDRTCHQEKDFVPLRGKIGICFQHAGDQLFGPTVLDDVAFGPLNQGLNRDEAYQIALQQLERLNIVGLKDRSVNTLSGGEQNFTALAGVLAMQPRVLLLDEPTNGLDVKNIAKLTALLRELQLPMLIASHDLRFSETLADSCLSLATDNNG